MRDILRLTRATMLFGFITGPTAIGCHPEAPAPSAASESSATAESPPPHLAKKGGLGTSRPTGEQPRLPELPVGSSSAPAISDALILDETNIDLLSYVDLKDATAALAEQTKAEDRANRGLLAWARYRLATRFGEQKVRKLLLADIREAATVESLDGLAASAAIGVLVLAGEVRSARRLAERLQRRQTKKSPQLAYVLASTYRRQPRNAKARRQLKLALRLAPGMTDAKLELGQLLLRGANAVEGERILIDLARGSEDLDATLHAAAVLIEGRRFDQLDAALTNLADVDQIVRVAPSRRDLFLKLLVRKHLRAGDLDGAVAVAERRGRERQQDVDIAIELARLKVAIGLAGRAVLEDLLKRINDPAARSRILAEQARQAVEMNDVDGATRILASVADLPGSDAKGWRKLAEGWVAKHEGQSGEARKAFLAATRYPSRAGEARLALLLAGPNKPHVFSKRLRNLDRRHGLPQAAYHLGSTLLERGDARNAAQLFNRILWLNPTAVDPIDLLIAWADSLDRSSQPERAEALLERLCAALADDPRPVHHAIQMAEGRARFDAVIRWYRVLIARDPNDEKVLKGYAGALINKGDVDQGGRLLERLFAANPEARDAEALVYLARVWQDREPARAIQLLNESIRMEPHANTYSRLGDTYLERNRIDEAKAAYTMALALDPKLTDAQVGLAQTYLRKAEVDKAVSTLRRATKLNPGSAPPYYYLGVALKGQGKAGEARRALRQYLRLEPEAAQRQRYLGSVRFEGLLLER